MGTTQSRSHGLPSLSLDGDCQSKDFQVMIRWGSGWPLPVSMVPTSPPRRKVLCAVRPAAHSTAFWPESLSTLKESSLKCVARKPRLSLRSPVLLSSLRHFLWLQV